jgi:hypothetical protein
MEKMVIKLDNPADTIKVQKILIELMQDLSSGIAYDCEIKRHREKRSLNANNYSWQLQTEIAKATNRSLTDIHNQMVLDYGVVEVYSILKTAFESAKRMFDYFEVLGEGVVNGKEFVHVKAGIGTHNYNSKEMARFIDGVVQEAKNLGIETMTPNELARLKAIWGEQ